MDDVPNSTPDEAAALEMAGLHSAGDDDGPAFVGERGPELLQLPGWLYAVVLQHPDGTVSTQLVRADNPDAAMRTLDWPPGARAWAVPVEGVHHFVNTDLPPTGPNGQPLVLYPQAVCPTCHGTLRQGQKPCPRCGGTGSVRQPGSHPLDLGGLRWVRQHRPYSSWPGTP